MATTVSIFEQNGKTQVTCRHNRGALTFHATASKDEVESALKQINSEYVSGEAGKNMTSRQRAEIRIEKLKEAFSAVTH